LQFSVFCSPILYVFATKPLKITIITPNYPPEVGACAYQMAYLAEQLVSRGHEVRVITALPNYPQGQIFRAYQGKNSQQENIKGVPVHRYWLYASHAKQLVLRLLSNLSLSISLLQSWRTLRHWQPDIVLVQTPPFLVGLSAWVLAWATSAKLVVNFSDLWYKGLVDWLQPFPLAIRLLKKIEFFLCKKAAFVLAQSQEIIDALEQSYPQKNYFLYRAGVDCQVFCPKNTNLPTKKFKIVYAGILGLAQGMLALCQQVNWQQLGIELHIWGDGVERKDIEKFIQTHPQQPIFLHQPVPQDELPTVLASFDMVLVAQKTVIYGTVPSKMYEAMACGVPVLLIGGGEAANLVEDNEAGVVVSPQASKHLEEHLQHIKQLPAEQLQKMGTNGRRLAENQFDKQKIFHSFIQIFEKHFQ
jgi:glycosyltransferase involved in cell wall biosynthesis